MIPLIQSNPIQSKPQLEGGGGGVHQPPLSLNRSSLPPAQVFWVHRTCTLGQTGMFPWEPTMLPGRVGRGWGEGKKEGVSYYLLLASKRLGFRVSNGLGTTKRCWELGGEESKQIHMLLCVLGWVKHGASQGVKLTTRVGKLFGQKMVDDEIDCFWFYALGILLLKIFSQCVCWWCCTHVAILISRVCFTSWPKKHYL